jgi:predicted SAM-dependent methyltransferase
MVKNKKTSNEFRAINLACGGKLCLKGGWINADHSPDNKQVKKINLLNRLPFDNNSFDVVYHSQFIEHLTPNVGLKFLHECYRILKPGGILRVVTPDLENQAIEYLKQLQELKCKPDSKYTRSKYNWIRLEMLDQLTRNITGGEMVAFINQSSSDEKAYILERLGRSGINMLPKVSENSRLNSLRRRVNQVIDRLTLKNYLVGKFRTSGEVHLTMYDEYLLGDLLIKCDFQDINRVCADLSSIKNWSETLLDSDGVAQLDCPTSLFMEARK